LFNGELDTNGYLSTIGDDLAVITLNQDTYAGVDQLDFLATGTGNATFETRPDGPVDATWANFYVPRRKGDSGAPAFLPFFGSAVLLGCWTNVNYGASALLNKDQINAAITSLGGSQSNWLKEAPYGASIVPNDGPIDLNANSNGQAWTAMATTPQIDIQDADGVQATQDLDSGDTLVRSLFPLSTIAGISTITQIDVTGTILSWSNSTDADGSLAVSLSNSTGTELTSQKTVFSMAAGGSGANVPVSASWTGLALTHFDLDDMALDMWSQFPFSTTGAANVVWGNVTVTVTYQ
jgi:hypothetical protein